MVYLSAGLFAEGPTDYRFFIPLLERLLTEISRNVIPEETEVPTPIGIDAPVGTLGGRENTLPAAIKENWDTCILFVVHSDGDADPENAYRTCVTPGVSQAKEMFPELVAVGCVPVKETEAWLLADPGVFVKFWGKAPTLPKDPEGVLDPKLEMVKMLREVGERDPRLSKVYEIFGANVSFEALRRLSAFRFFEQELTEAVRRVARPG